MTPIKLAVGIWIALAMPAVFFLTYLIMDANLAAITTALIQVNPNLPEPALTFLGILWLAEAFAMGTLIMLGLWITNQTI